jgi:hypothetical protein
MANLTIEKCNEVYLKITTEPHIEYELRDHFRFEVPNAKFMPQYFVLIIITLMSL